MKATGNKGLKKLINLVMSAIDSKLSITGGTLTGDLTCKKYISLNAWPNYGTGSAKAWYNGNTKTIDFEGDVKNIDLNASSSAVADRLKDFESGSTGTSAYRWTKVLSLQVTVRYQDAFAHGFLNDMGTGNSYSNCAEFYVRLKQQSAMGEEPSITLDVHNVTNGFKPEHLRLYIKENTTSATVVELWALLPVSYECYKLALYSYSTERTNILIGGQLYDQPDLDTKFISGILKNTASDSDTVDGKHASDFILASDICNVTGTSSVSGVTVIVPPLVKRGVQSTYYVCSMSDADFSIDEETTRSDGLVTTIMRTHRPATGQVASFRVSQMTFTTYGNAKINIV